MKFLMKSEFHSWEQSILFLHRESLQGQQWPCQAQPWAEQVLQGCVTQQLLRRDHFSSHWSLSPSACSSWVPLLPFPSLSAPLQCTQVICSAWRGRESCWIPKYCQKNALASNRTLEITGNLLVSHSHSSAEYFCSVQLEKVSCATLHCQGRFGCLISRAAHSLFLSSFFKGN